MHDLPSSCLECLAQGRRSQIIRGIFLSDLFVTPKPKHATIKYRCSRGHKFEVQNGEQIPLFHEKTAVHHSPKSMREAGLDPLA